MSDEAAIVAALQTPPGFTMEEIKDHQERDEHLRDIQKWKNEPPSEMEKQLMSPDQRRLLAFLPSLHQDPSSSLWSLQTQEEGASSKHLYILHALRHRVIEAAHQFLGHAGITATAHFCRKRFICSGSGGASCPPTLSHVSSEEPTESKPEGCPSPQCPSRRPVPGREYGCTGPLTCQLRRAPVLAHVEEHLRQVV